MAIKSCVASLNFTKVNFHIENSGVIIADNSFGCLVVCVLVLLTN